MSSPEVEKFEVTDEDLLNEFNPNRRQFRQSKNRATYGMWAADSDDDDDRPSFKGGGKSGNYASGISFISGGFKAASKLPVDSEMLERGPKDDRFSDSEDEAPPPPKIAAKTQKKMKNSGFSARHQTSDNIGNWEKHTRGIGAKLLGKMGHVSGQGLGKNQQGITTPVEAKLRKGKAAIGFYGSERVPSSLPQARVQEDSEEEEEKQFNQQLQQWRKDGEGASGKKKLRYNYKTADELLVRSKGRTNKRANNSNLAKVKVIDMTSKEQRVMSGYHALSIKHDRPDDEASPIRQEGTKRSFDLPELIHNLDLLVNMSEEEIINNNMRSQHESDLEVNLKHESNKLTDICAQEAKEVNRLKDVFEIIEDCERRMQQDCMDALGIEECIQVFKKLQRDYIQEYNMYNLSTMAIALGVPLMKSELEGWQPLRHPHLCHAAMEEWKTLLQDPYKSSSNKSSARGTGTQSSVQMDPYDRLVWDVLMPHVRAMTLESWKVKECDDIIGFLELWQPLLPEWVIDNINEQLILPRLQKGVDSWNPTQDRMPIHAWLHPWLPFMGDRLEPLYAPIRHKLANALRNWHPSDNSAKMILDPWKGVFKKGHMDGFLCTNILPKLTVVMTEFVINPQKQVLEPWLWVTSWQDLLPQSAMLTLIEKHFFPKWHQVLSTWLNNRPNYEEVSNWYKGWKSMIPEELVATAQVKEQLNIALTMMDRAVAGNLPPGTSSYLTSKEPSGTPLATRISNNSPLAARISNSPPVGRNTPPPMPPPPRDSYRASNYSSSVPESFKDLVARKAEEQGILFMPIPNKTHEARQVYKLGSAQICIDRSVIFINSPTKGWIPTSLNAALDSILRV